MSAPHPDTAARLGWSIADRPLPVSTGVSRLTWSWGSKYLLGWEERHRPELRRELALLGALNVPDIATPIVVPTRTGTPFYADGRGWIWAITEAVPGVLADPADPSHYQAAATALSQLHQALAPLPSTLAVRSAGPVEVSRDALTKNLPTAPDAAAATVVDDAKVWLNRHLCVLEQSPCQIIHGDWILANVRLDCGSPAHVSGLLDFERCSVAPVAIDVAQLVAEMLWCSGSPEPEATARALVKLYQRAGGGLICGEILAAALVAYWFDNWLWLEERVRTGEARLAAALGRQPSRLEAAMRLAREPLLRNLLNRCVDREEGVVMTREVPSLSREELVEHLASDHPPTLVEALPSRQYDRAHIVSAVNVPYDRVDLAPEVLPDLNVDIVVYCARDRCERGRELAAQLLELGYKRVSEYPGGKQDWHRNGLPITGDMPPYSS